MSVFARTHCNQLDTLIDMISSHPAHRDISFQKKTTTLLCCSVQIF